jgi:hypothetical protein
MSRYPGKKRPDKSPRAGLAQKQTLALAEGSVSSCPETPYQPSRRKGHSYERKKRKGKRNEGKKAGFADMILWTFHCFEERRWRLFSTDTLGNKDIKR